MNGDGTGITRVTRAGGSNQKPSLSADRRRIAYASSIDGSNSALELRLINADGSGDVQLTSSPGADTDPDFSRDGRHIVFEATRSFNTDIFLLDISNPAAPLETRLTTSGRLDRQPVFAPDGRIVFMQETPGALPGQFRVARMNADGTGVAPVSSGPSDFTPAVSPDGSRICFVSTRDGNEEIYVMNADGSGETRLTSAASADRSPTFSPDGRRIVFVSDRLHVPDPANPAKPRNFEIFVMNADGSSPARLTSHPAPDTFPNVR